MADPYIGEIRQFAGNFAPVGWLFCSGQTLAISEYDVLYNLIGTTYGGDGQNTFSLPDLRGRVPIHVSSQFPLGSAAGAETATLISTQLPAHSHAVSAATAGTTDIVDNNYFAASSLKPYTATASNTVMASDLSAVGGGQPHDNMVPFQVVSFIISYQGIYPSQGGGAANNPYLGQVDLFSFLFAPGGFVQCNGQILPVAQNQALYSLLGTTYGGNGSTTFNLPDLRGRSAACFGVSFSGNLVLGQTGGEAAHTLTVQEMPAHNHILSAGPTPDRNTPTGNFFASGTGGMAYAETANTTMNAGAVAATGSSLAHNNMSPYLVLNFCIAIIGIYPPRN